LQDVTALKFVFAPSLFFLILSIFYRVVWDKITFERQQKEKVAEQLSSELQFLRSQISPHFLFNVLTNLVSLARKKSDKLEPSLLMLADLMRYMLYDMQEKKVPLQVEIDYLKSYIELQKLRFGSDVRIETSIEIGAEQPPYSLEPMLLIPFVENAFKHGVGWMEDPYIRIILVLQQGVLRFEVQNKIDKERDNSKDTSSGSDWQMSGPGYNSCILICIN
jgi:sensor histidine kinase YesM